MPWGGGAFVQWGGAPRREALLHHRPHCTRRHSASAGRQTDRRRRLAGPSARLPGPSPGAPPPAQTPAGQEPLPAAAAGLGGGGGSSLGNREAPAGPGAGCGGLRGAGPGDAVEKEGDGRWGERQGRGRRGRARSAGPETFALSAGGQEKHPRRLIRGRHGIRSGEFGLQERGLKARW